MSLVHVLQHTPSFIPVLWSGCIGWMAVMIISLFLFLQLLYGFINKFKIADRNDHFKLKTPYMLVMLYLVLSFVSSIIFLTLETNMLTPRTLKFTKARCESAWIMKGAFHGINYMVLSFIFLHRIYIVFKGSAFEYNPWVYRSFFCFIITSCPIIFTVLYLPLIGKFQAILKYDPITNLAICAAQTWDPLDFVVLSITSSIVQIISFIGLLVLFIRRLHSLNMEMMASFVKETMTNKPNVVESESGRNDHATAADSASQSSQSSLDVAANTNRIQPCVSAVLDLWDGQSISRKHQSRTKLARIMRLHNLMKKQTILVFIAIVSSITSWIAVGIDADIVQEMGWDNAVNLICVWLMLDTSKGYWNICRKYGICFCCYWRSNKMGM